MPTIEQALAKLTYKQEGLETEKRVFYTLLGDEASQASRSLQTHRNSKALGLLFKVLLEKGLLTEEELDQILLEVVS